MKSHSLVFAFMRLDLFLKVSRIVSKRSLANDLCDRGLIRVNDDLAKPAKNVHVGDQIEIKRESKKIKAVVLSIPGSNQVSKEIARSLYEIVSETIDPRLA